MGKAKAGGKTKKVQEKKANKIVEDKTFGLKNKNKSKKVQQYIKQVNANVKGGGKSEEYLRQQAAKKKAEKEARKQAEKEMLELLGAEYAMATKKKKKIKPKGLSKKELEEKAAKEAEEQEKQKAQDAKDFGTPICALRDVFGLGSKALVERICCELVHKDNLPGKLHDGSPCLYIKVADGTTLNPMVMSFAGETPQSFQFKVGNVLDVRGCMAMVRGERVLLEVPKGAQGLSQPLAGVEASVEVASERLSEFVKEKMKEEEEIRARGGIPIEERIEEERANLKGPLTPVTKERFFAWKAKKQKEKEARLKEERKAAAKKASGGKGVSFLTGRDLFSKDRSLFVDDDGTLGDLDDDEQNDAEKNDSENEEEEDDSDVKAPQPPSGGGDDKKVDEATAAIKESLYLEGDDDDLDDLDDLDDDDDDE